MIVLGIETTCDETAAAVVRRFEDGRGEILSDIVLSQVEKHAAYGGVVPEIAARAHVEVLDTIIAKAMAQAGCNFSALDGVAAAAGPGLIGGVIVGLTTAKAIALVANKPLIAVNHLEAHALTARLTDNIPFPYCLLLASGGHTQIVAVRGIGDYVRLGTTQDDAIGEAFDKTAKLLGLGYPGGPQVEKEAARGNATQFTLPRPMHGRKEPISRFPVSKPHCGWKPKKSHHLAIRMSPTFAPVSSRRSSTLYTIGSGPACCCSASVSARPPRWLPPVALPQTSRSARCSTALRSKSAPR